MNNEQPTFKLWQVIAIGIVFFFAVSFAIAYFTAKNDPLNNVDIDLFLEGCSYIFKPDGSYDVVKFGDPRCPK
ncbi:hypothetical protein [Phormidium tenue]|uniref:Uncharacterized protein n=1 Tax=Phormidium tenue FACHB-1050 TaxID=2692857 RepID=A0ABR8CGM5_9CYAN|nr:hypothetical protein [Phormidium tenue]MBD2319953.1 hypothetical protein [Phormidium tenue FACHB-1050]